jgi:hypothetical protein
MSPADAVDESELDLLRDLFFRVGEELEQEIGDGIRLMAELKQQRAGLKHGPTWDDGRRRLQNPRFRTTYPDERIRVLQARSMDLREEIGGVMRGVIKSALKLEITEAELRAAKVLKAEIDAANAIEETTGCHPETLKAIKSLQGQYRIAWTHWAAADPATLKRIAEILRDEDGLISYDERKAEEAVRWGKGHG